MALSDLYYALEDRYYGLVEKIGLTGPVDAIDKVVPSFILVLVVIAGLIIFLASTLIFPPAPSAILLVTDDEGTPLPGIFVRVYYDDKTFTGSTDDQGKIKVDFFGSLTVEIKEVEGFEDLTETVDLSPGGFKTIVLQTIVVAPAKKTIVVKDDEGNPITGKEIVVKFKCSGTATPPREIHNYTNTIYVEPPKNCGTLSANVIVSGFVAKEKALIADRTIFILSPKTSTTLTLQPKKAYLNVFVSDKQGSPLDNIQLVLLEDIGTTNSKQVKTAVTSSTGTYSFHIPLGKYKVKAVDLSGAHRTVESSWKDLSTANESVDLSLEMEAVDPSKQRKLLIKVVDAETNEGLQASVFIYANSTLVSSMATLADGTLEYNGVDANESHSLVVKSEGYVNKVVEDIELVAVNLQTPIKVALAKAEKDAEHNPLNYVEIEALVLDDEDVPVEGATVSVYNEAFPGLELDPLVTDEEGKATFTLLPALNKAYFIEADNGLASGTSAKQVFTAGAHALTVTLVLAEASLKVHVTGSANIAGATVKVIDYVTGKTFAETATNTLGKTEKISFTIDKFPVVKVEKDGFLTYTSHYQVFTKNEYKLIKVELQDEDIAPDLDLALEGIYDESGQLAENFRPGEMYALKFVLTAGSNLTDVVAHFSVNPDEAALDDLVLKVVGGESVRGSVLKSSSIDSANLFADGDIVSGEARGRQLNVKFQSLPAGVYEFLVIVEVDAEAVEEAIASFKFKAKGLKAGQLIETDLVEQSFRLDQPLFCDPVDPDCPNFIFSFTLFSEEDERFKGGVRIDLDEEIELFKDIEYSLEFVVWNQLEESFSDVSATLSEKNNLNALSITGSKTLALGDLRARSSVASSFGFRPVESGATTLKVTLSVDRADNEAQVKFNIAEPGELVLEFKPYARIQAGVKNYLHVFVFDQGGNAVPNASVSVEKNGEAFRGSTILQTNSQGYTYLIIYSDEAVSGDQFAFTAEKNPFQPHTETITATDVILFASLQDRFKECLEFSEETLTAPGSLIITNNCVKAVSIKFIDPNALPLEVSPNFSRSFDIEKDQSEIIEVAGAEWPGQYGIYVHAKYADEAEALFEKGFIKEIKAIVNPSQGDCFTMKNNKYEFDIFRKTDSGTIHNACFPSPAVLDEEIPELMLDPASVAEAVAIMLEEPEPAPAEAEPKDIFFNATPKGFERVDSAQQIDYSYFELLKNEAVEIPILESGKAVRLREATAFTQAIGYWNEPRYIAPVTWPPYKFFAFGDAVWNELPGWALYGYPWPEEQKLDLRASKIKIVFGNEIESTVADKSYIQAFSGVVDEDFEGEVNQKNVFEREVFVPCNQDHFQVIALAAPNGVTAEGTFGADEDWFNVYVDSVSRTTAGTTLLKIKVETFNKIAVKGFSWLAFCLPKGYPDEETPVIGGAGHYWDERKNRANENVTYININPTTDKTPKDLRIPHNLDVEDLREKYDVYAFVAPAGFTDRGNFGGNEQVKAWVDNVDSTFVYAKVVQFSPWRDSYLSGVNWLVLAVPKGWDKALDFEQGVEEYDHQGSEGLDYINYEDKHYFDHSIETTRFKNVVGMAFPASIYDSDLFGGGEFVKARATTLDESKAEADVRLYGTNTHIDGLQYLFVGLPLSQKVYGLKLTYLPTDFPQADINFTVFAKDFGRRYGLISVKDYVTEADQTILKEEKFHVKFDAGSNDICYGRNFKEGLTGEEAKPRIKLAWNWDEINLDSCDELKIKNGTTNSDYFYCDATQLTIELLRKLNYLKNNSDLIGTEAAVPYTNFNAYLIEDGFSKDFINDFDEYYIEKGFFADTPTWYDKDPDALNKIFTDPARFSFQLGEGLTEIPWLKEKGSQENKASFAVLPLELPLLPSTALPGPGLYNVNLGLEFDDASTNFFRAGQPNVRVKVTFNKVAEPGNDNPFYHLPFNAELGLNETTGSLEREGYGRAFTVSGDISIQVTTFPTVNMRSGTGLLSNINAVKEDDYVLTNGSGDKKTLRGSVLYLTSNELKFLPSNATPVLMKLENKPVDRWAAALLSNAHTYYYLKKNDSVFSPGDSANFWTGVGSTLGSVACRDFDDELLPFLQPDVKWSNGACELAADAPNDSFGFSYSRLDLAYDNMVFFQTIFFTPFDDSFELFAACKDLSTENTGSCWFLDAAGHQILEAGFIPLDYTKARVWETAPSLEEIFRLIDQEHLCTAFNENEVDVWWNEQKLYSELKEQIKAKPGFQEVDFDCINLGTPGVQFAEPPRTSYAPLIWTMNAGEEVALNPGWQSPYGASVSSSYTGLPSGLGYDPLTGIISGTATTPGTYTVTGTGEDFLGTVSTHTTTVVVLAQEDCDDGLDNDDDLWIDCGDPDCVREPNCLVPGTGIEETCSTGISEDLDIWADCYDTVACCVQDPNCSAHPACQYTVPRPPWPPNPIPNPVFPWPWPGAPPAGWPAGVTVAPEDADKDIVPGGEDCGNGLDDDEDGLMDCSDYYDCCTLACEQEVDCVNFRSLMESSIILTSAGIEAAGVGAEVGGAEAGIEAQ